ncbi:MAG: nucleotidyltransferase family protein [Bacteroidetes bacterium]|nr:nucleotidyltransferase family protein [Bacteroidota bacterium]
MAEKTSDFKWIAIVLAAGSSTRMGQSKQLLKIDDETLIHKTVRTSIDAGGNGTIVVLGADHERIKDELNDFSIDLIVNPEWEKGMGSSLKCGLTYAMNFFLDVEAVMILVCDQPLLNSIHLKKIIEEHYKTKSPIVASFYSERKGVPALFHKSTFEKLLTVEDRQGAKRIIEENPTLVKSIDFPEGVVDLDTPEDYENFRVQI